MPDLVFEHCRNFTRPIVAASTDDYKHIAEAFTDNINRIYSTACFPPHINFWSTMFGASIGAAIERLSGWGSEETPQSRELGRQLFQEWLAHNADVSPLDFHAHSWAMGASNLSLMLTTDESGRFEKAAAATLATMIMAGWAALETLAVDLWQAAVNRHSDVLGLKVAERYNEKQVTLKTLASYSFDLRNKVADVLLEGRKISLDNYNEFLTAYQNAFGEDWTFVFDKYPNLRLVEITRHLFAHRSGRVDKRFLEKATKLGAFQTAKLNEILEIDGDFTAMCVDNCARCGLDLLYFVDEWSQAHGPSEPE